MSDDQWKSDTRTMLLLDILDEIVWSLRHAGAPHATVRNKIEELRAHFIEEGGL